MRLKALVLDDDVQHLNLTEAYLEDKGFDVSAYLQVPPPVLEQVAECRSLSEPIYDLVLVDNDMPNMKGIEFLEHIEEKGCKIPNTRKAILSGCISNDERNRAKDLGVKVFDKPCSLDVLDKWIETALGG